MNHPACEEWVPYLFGEANTETRQKLQTHLAACAECRQELERWQNSLTRLDAWKLQPAQKRSQVIAPLVRWAAAAAIVLAASFGLGRLSAPKLEAAAMRAALAPDLQQQASNTHRQMESAIAALGKTLSERRAEDNRAIVELFEKVEAQHTADVLALKRELDTVALNTDAGLRQAEQQLVQLADSTQPANR